MNLRNMILALSFVNTVKLVVLLDLGTTEFVEQKSYFTENAGVAVSLFKLRSSCQTSLMPFLLVAACTRMLVLPSSAALLAFWSPVSLISANSPPAS